MGSGLFDIRIIAELLNNQFSCSKPNSKESILTNLLNDRAINSTLYYN